MKLIRSMVRIVRTFLRLAWLLRPRFILIENVSGMITLSEDIIRWIMQSLVSNNYQVTPGESSLCFACEPWLILWRIDASRIAASGVLRRTAEQVARIPDGGYAKSCSPLHF